jgi:hypothetical protein
MLRRTDWEFARLSGLKLKTKTKKKAETGKPGDPDSNSTGIVLSSGCAAQKHSLCYRLSCSCPCHRYLSRTYKVKHKNSPAGGKPPHPA